MASGCLTDELENDNNVCDYDYAYDEYEDCTQTASNRCESVVEALSPRFKPKIANKLNNGINFNELSQISLDKHNSDKENCAMQIGLPPHMPIDDEQTDQTTNDSYNASNSRESSGRSTGLRSNDKRGRPTNARKEKRRMREKRRSTGVVHLHMSTESTGEEEDGAKIVTVETKQNTQTNEVISSGNVETCEMTSQSYLCVSTTKTTVGSGQEGDYEDNSDDEDLQNFSLCVPAESSSTHRHQITQEEAGLEPISHPAIQEDLLHGVEPSPDSDRATLEQDIMKFIQLWEEEREVNQQLIENLDRSNERIRDLGDELGFVSMDLHKLLKENRSLKEENEDLAMENQALISAIQNIKI